MVNIEIPCKAFSINAAYYKSRAIKTKDCQEWETLVLSHLAEFKEFYDMAEDHKKKPMCYAVELDFVYPYHIYLNKSGEISSKTFDLSNVEKLLLDLIFGDTMGVNDKFVTSLHSRKMPGAVHAIRIRIWPY